MVADGSARPPRWTTLVGWVWSVVILGLGVWVSLATGEWIALLCAAGLVILPLGGMALRASRA
jgi:hypothetical protein